MSNVFHDVYDFHAKFGVFERVEPGSMAASTFEFRRKFLQEELNEFIAANANDDVEGQLDAMIDLIYVAAGTLVMMGFLPTQMNEAWRRVQEANMQKMRVPSAEHSKRGSAYDVIKPDGWKAPDLSDLCR